MSEKEKTLKELMWEIHHETYGITPQPVFNERKARSLEEFLPKKKPVPHQVTDTTVQQEVKS